MASPRIAVFPGSFDPPTLGHLDLIRRASGLFDSVIVTVLRNAAKKTLFPLDDRLAMLRSAVADVPNVEVEAFEGLLVDFAARRGAVAIVRGLRGGADFDYERQMAGTNQHLNARIETLFLVPTPVYSHISSTLVREIAAVGGSVAGLVPPIVETYFERRHMPPRTQSI